MSEASDSLRKAMTTRRFESNAEGDRRDAEYWRRVPAAERVLQAWKLSLEQWRLSGRAADEPGLCRSLRAFVAADVRFLVVGAYALTHHGRPRATGDLDVWVEATSENAARVIESLTAFGAPLHYVQEGDFSEPGIVFQIGWCDHEPPRLKRSTLGRPRVCMEHAKCVGCATA